MTACKLEVWVEVYPQYNERRVILVTEFGDYTVGSYSHAFYLQTKLDNALSDAKKLAATLGIPFITVCDMHTQGAPCYQVPIKKTSIKTQKINPCSP